MTRNMSLNRFLSICEKLIYKWQRAALTYEYTTDKRDLEEPEEDTRDKKKAKSSPRAAL